MMQIKKDNFISVGIIINENIKPLQIYDLHKQLNNYYNYFEIILLNTNSIANQYDNILKDLKNIRILELSSKIDIEYAHAALIENCIGDYCAILDLNHDNLNDLEIMLEKAENYDVIIGKREKKIQSFLESLTSFLFYKIIYLFTGIKINQMYSDFFVINRKVINFITKNEDKVKCLKLLKLNNGFSLYEHSYLPVGRKSFKRTLFENINFTMDILVSYSHRLIRLATMLSLLTSITNLFYIFYVFAIYLFKNDVVEGWTSTNLYNSSMYFVLFLVLSILGEYIRILLQNQKNTYAYEITNEKSSIALFSDKKNIDKE